MDSTPNPIQAQPLSSIKASAGKLPIKRKNPDSFSSNPNPISSPILTTPKLETDYGGEEDADHDTTLGGDTRPPPFKFHRIWTEPDEIRFLHGLLDCSSEGLSFPRDLSIFYARFSNTMSQPYTKSQLSEKLRRLRKKFRVISSRLSKGLDKALLSPHDRALYDLSKQLWHPDYSFTSPFSASNNKPNKSNLVGVEVSFSPTLPSSSTAILALPCPVSNQTMIQELNGTSIEGDNNNVDHGFEGGLDANADVELSEVNVELEDGVAEEELSVMSDSDSVIVRAATKALVEVFDQSLKEVGMVVDRHGSASEASSMEGKEKSFEQRWREQMVAEFEVMAKRLRLVVEYSLPKQ